MAYPILYKATEENFEHLVVSVLSDAIKTTTSSESNGALTLEMEYPVNGKDVEKIEKGMILKADAGYRRKNQRYIISQITKNEDKVVVYAEHISMVKTMLNAIRPDISISGTASTALKMWKANLLDSSDEFFVDSDITTLNSTIWKVETIENARDALGGKQGSILDVWGGEYVFDNLNIFLYKQAGEDNPTIIAYGKNLLELEQEDSIISTYTSVFPFKKTTDEQDSKKEILLTLPELVVDSPHVNKFTHRRILKVDFSSDETIKTVEQLRSKANAYIKSNNVGVPKVNLKIKYQDLSKVAGVFDTPALEKVDLYDRLKVYYEDLGIMNENAKVIKTVWNVILEEYDSIEVGDTRSSFSQSSGTMARVEALENQQSRIYNQINKMIQADEEAFNRFYNEKHKELEDAVKDGVEKAKLKAEEIVRKSNESIDAKLDTVRSEVSSDLEKFKNTFNPLNTDEIERIRREIGEVSQVANTTLKMVGTDDSITYNKNRVEGATEREIALGTDYIEVNHNGDGYEVGKPYTISWEAVCRQHDFSDVNIVLSKAPEFPLTVKFTPTNNFYPTLYKNFNKGEQKGVLLHVYHGTYRQKVVSDWYRELEAPRIIKGATTSTVIVFYKTNADANATSDNYIGEWNSEPKYIFDGGNNE